jgi:hypothetical protein
MFRKIKQTAIQGPGNLRAGDKDRPLRRPLLSRRKPYLTWTPEIAREMTKRWISEVPSKIV